MAFLPAKLRSWVPILLRRPSIPMAGKALKARGRRLFPQITVILCFLHAFLKIRDRATKTLSALKVQKRVWEAYHAPSKRAFSQRLRRLRAWAEDGRACPSA